MRILKEVSVEGKTTEITMELAQSDFKEQKKSVVDQIDKLLEQGTKVTLKPAKEYKTFF